MINNIQNYLNLLNISNSELAKAIGVTNSRMNDIKSNRYKSINLDVMSDIIEALENFSNIKSKGKQVLLLNMEDVFMKG